MTFGAKAEPLLLLSEGSASGTQGQILKVFSDVLESNNIRTTIKVTNNNCALARLNWLSSKSPTLLMVTHGAGLGLADKSNPHCFIPFTEKDIVYWVYSDPFTFCSAGAKSWEDFTTPNTTHTVAIHPDNNSEKLFSEIANKYNTRIKVIKIAASPELLTMVKAGEIDFAFRTGITAFEQFNNKCYWAAVNTKDLPAMEQFVNFSSMRGSTFTINVYFAAKNLNTTAILPLLHEASVSAEMDKINKRRGFDPKLVHYKNDIEYKAKMRELFSLIFD